MESYTFKAEISELMNMIIHNFYSNKDIFLRELVSNASDALNKLKYNSLTNSELLSSFNQFDIRVSLDKTNSVLTIEDTGIGMTKDDLVNNLGTIAKSGTKEFLKKLQKSEKDNSSNLIGQFGVGFYSAYLVADRVKVMTRYAGSDETWEWESMANGTFNIQQTENFDTFLRGTRLQLFIKPDELDYLEEYKVTEIIKKHSAYITYPIMLFTSKEVEEEAPVSEETATTETTTEATEATTPETTTEATEVTAPEATDQNLDEIVTVEDVTDDNDMPSLEEETETETKTETMPPTKNMVKRTVSEWTKINSEPLWVKPSSDITDKEHEDFYKSLSGDWDSYLTYKHFKVEGNLEFTGLLYFPKHSPNDMFGKKDKKSIKLYVKKVLISDNCEDLYPEWMGFVKGLVDSYDMPLNASRELLQQSKIVKQINKNLVKKTIEMMTELMEDNDKYLEFYKNFDKNIKLGIHEEQKANKDKLVELLRFNTSTGTYTSLKTYVSRMKEKQTGIYYITGESLKAVENSPFVDKLKRLEYEVVYMTDPIDEYIIQHITEYDGKKLINVTKDDLALGDLESKADLQQYNVLCEKLKKMLGDKVEKVIVSTKIESQPAIVTNPFGMSANMERIMKAQALGNNNNNPMYAMMLNKKVLEINPEHNIMKKLNTLLLEETVSTNTSTLVDMVFNSALLAGGYQVSDINDYLKNVYSQLTTSMN